MDVMTFALPFFLIFAIVYGSLEVAGTFKENKKVNAIISLVVGFFAITSEQVVNLIYMFMPHAAVIFIIVFFLGFILSPFRGKGEGKDYSLIVVIAALVMLFLASQTQQMLVNILGISGENIFALAGLFLIIVIFYAAYQHSKG